MTVPVTIRPVHWPRWGHYPRRPPPMSRRDDRSGMEDGVRLTLLEVDVDKIEKETRAGFDRVGKSVDDLREDVTSELKEIRSKQDASETRSRQLQIAILVALISVLVALAANLAFPVR